MMRLLSSLARGVAPAQVWGGLAADLQTRAIRLMAHLAVQRLAAPSPTTPSEADDARSAPPS